jgi:prolyl oligopeptidase
MKCFAYLLMVSAIALPALSQRLDYPKTRTVEQVDDYHSVKISDPYRWLEDDNSADTKTWIQSQNALTTPYLEGIAGRNAIRARLTKLFNYERYGAVFKEGNKYFYFRNDGLQDRDVLYVTRDLNAPGDVLIDPNKFEDKSMALSNVSVSPDGKIIAYSIATAGSDWNEIRLMEIDSRKQLTDHIKWVKFSDAAWSEDNKGIYYSRYDEPKDGILSRGANYNQKLYYHRLGSAQADDKLIYQRPDHKDWGFGGGETEDGKYVTVHIWQGTERNNAWFYRPVDSDKFVELLAGWDAAYNFIGNRGSLFFFETDSDAPRSRVIAIDINKPAKANWKEIVPESTEAILNVKYTGRRFFASYLRDGRSEVRMFDESGKSLGIVPLPGLGKAAGFGGRHDATETFYTFTSYTVPSVVYRYDVKTNRSTVWKEPKVDADLKAYETKLVFYNSKDGTRVPMFITARKDAKLDGQNPVYLYGYGGFNIPVTIAYSPKNIVWLEMGGILAFPALRGGGEYGKEWHLAGTKLRKQNVFNDFIAAAEYLIANKYTNPKKIAINGGSNGGLLVAATLLQRPELFGAAVPQVGVLDMLRFHKFTIGWGWVSDYGSADNPEEFKALRAYSPLHNVKKGVVYPPTMITTADHDDRVVPGHSFKFAAALQAAQEGNAPILLRVETKAGHGAGRRLSAAIEEQSDIIAFMAKNLGMNASIAKLAN